MARIIYIEDDESTRNCTVTMLKRLGHSVLPRIDTINLDSLTSIYKPDLVIADHNLGEGKEKGLQAAIRLKDNKINVVMLSGNHDALLEAEAAGIPFFTKPYLIKTLLDKINL